MNKGLINMKYKKLFVFIKQRELQLFIQIKEFIQSSNKI